MGLSLSYALSLTGTQIFLTRWYCNLSNYIISVERIKQFMHIPPEPPAIVDGKRPPSDWPSKGRIELHSLEVKNTSSFLHMIFHLLAVWGLNHVLLVFEQKISQNRSIMCVQLYITHVPPILE